MLSTCPGSADARVAPTQRTYAIATPPATPGGLPSGPDRTREAALGLLDRVQIHVASSTPTADEVTRAFWGACHGGRRSGARYLLERGADLNWIPPWEDLRPLDAAEREYADELARWLRDRGARSAAELDR